MYPGVPNLVSGIPQTRAHCLHAACSSIVLVRLPARQRTVSVCLETVQDYKTARMKCAVELARYFLKVRKKSVLLS